MFRKHDLPSDEIIGPDERVERERELADFTTTRRVAGLIVIAVAIGAASAVVALLLLKSIAFVTNLAYFQTASIGEVSPSQHRLGWWSVLIPVGGGLVVGLMARFGSERIRGHGIPEAMETILVGGSKSQPRVAVLKPISSAISIGTGGPFGSEGPIILTGGAVGSVIGQFFHLSAIERRSLLVAGSSAGMAAVFGTPVAAVLLGVELLLFEWRPRSMVLVAFASTVGVVVRSRFVALGWLPDLPLFPSQASLDDGAANLGGVLAMGLVGGAAALILTRLVYAAEDAFNHLPIHWMWWPAIGGAVVGLGGMLEPRALGVGYSVIGDGIAGRLTVASLVTILLVKLVIWAVALGSGTSGGILAPILIVGVCLGGIAGHVLPGPIGAWAIVGMAAVMAGVMRSPLTAIVFGFELTLDVSVLVPLLFACTTAHLLSVLVLKRSILTEKVARRGFHVLREYGVGPMEALFVREVMDTNPVVISPTASLADAYALGEAQSDLRRQRLLPVLGEERELVGVIRWVDVLELAARGDLDHRVHEIMEPQPSIAFPEQTLREVADRMATERVGVMPVVERNGTLKLAGLVSQFSLLAAHERMLVEERHRERVLGPTFLRRT